MASEKQPDSFLAAVDAKIAAWTAVRTSYVAALALEGSALPDITQASIRTEPTALPVGVFRDKGVKEAIPIFLAAARRKQTNKEIAAGLIGGGIATTSANFEATVATALLRLKNEGVVLRFQDGWDMASSYPESLRGRLEKDAAPKKGPKAKRGKKVKATAPAKASGHMKVVKPTTEPEAAAS